ncbi:BnaAnng26890D [Brassica napus]|uniref:BnaAnng26890D protein n=2 Tax=Brassica napus TaxID=3708 RepID=A0A078JSE9_BRANA|nr:BnaAnng26890D [Brassica napus]
MHGCYKLKKISPNISKLENLENLCLSGEYDEYSSPNFFEAIIEWGPDFERRWNLISNFKVDYILPICLPEKALTSPISLCFRSNVLKTIPDCIRRLSGLSKLDITKCRNLVALPQLPGPLLSVNAEGCKYLKRIDSSFQNPNICLNFARCFNLNQKARKLIQTSACKYAVLPDKKVPAHFTHRATSGSITINLTPTPLPSSFRFKACIFLSKGKIYSEGDVVEMSSNLLMGVSCHVRGKQNGLTVRCRSYQLHMPGLVGCCREHLYIFEDSFCLNQDFPEAEEAVFSELSFVFRVHDKTSKVKGCGVRLLEEVPQCILDRKETVDEECMVINIEANNEIAGGQDEEKEEDMDDEADDGVNDEEDEGADDTGLSDEGRDINIEEENETEEGEESGNERGYSLV